MATVSVKFTHRFVEKTYHRWTFCDHCNKVLWGIVKQGLECVECGYICHKRCQDELTFVCDRRLRSDPSLTPDTEMCASPLPSADPADTPPTEEVFSDSDLPSHEARQSERRSRYASSDQASVISQSDRASILTAATERNRQRQSVMLNDNRSSTSTSASSYTVVDGTASLDRTYSRRSKRSQRSMNSVKSTASSTSIIQDLIVSTAANQMAMERDIQPASLNLVTRTPKNMQRFVQRAGALGSAENAVKYVMTWQSPSTTMLCMVGYALLCFYPLLLTIIPHLVVLHLIVRYYFMRAREIAVARAGSKRRNAARRNERSHPLNMLSPTSATSVNEYKMNMQYIQNFMGTFADIYDIVASQLHHLDWSDPQHTANLFKLLVLAMFGTLAFFWLVPIHWVLLVAGEVAFVANTAVVKAFADTVVPVLLERANLRVEQAQRFVQKTA